ncbi:RdgB/HAM1 family non-canonical purine NTP pyrophosphatase [Luteipulveratus halotolerans]|uniref:dITP/XTP pyrophosphatase n=1 Tax=Luteipulveratus halotolerans TaxID=1631356 RepID=A0A0L6CFU0_9MICO|nr:RdgB/HAM1 family non-canonical purine NTP pyrophosphatase [Luteipulveratus halotolerans]KNX36696.1 nucleoside-triphosphate diphosphatase [Luteipulveratus halotolerans]
MGRQLVLATRNPGKLRELRQLLAGVPELADVEVLGAGDIEGVPEVAETGVTFEENSRLKSQAVAKATNLPAIADDSGLTVDVLGAAPGVWSAMWSGRTGDDQANIDTLQGQLADVAVERLTAYFSSTVVLTLPDGTERVHVGRVDGRLTRDQRGTNGFGYDPIFELPDGRTLAELSDDDKNAISHRGNAFRALLPDLVELLS